MAQKLKDRFFTEESISAFAEVIQGQEPGFDAEGFKARLAEDSFSSLELMQMARRATEILRELLPGPYRRNMEILSGALPHVDGMEAFCLPTFVELYGLADWETSLPAMALFTTRVSAEFAIRPFILEDPKRAMAFLLELSREKHPNVRRFSSEGCRPRLPWAVALPAFKEDPTPILPILENLKDDDSTFVQKSVANNLNDISKDHPDLVLTTCERWQGSSDAADWIIKRACRTLLKAGDTRAMVLFGFGSPEALGVGEIGLSKTTARIGEDLRLSFQLEVETEEAVKVRLEYAVWYVKARGKTSKKVFQIREAHYEPGIHEISRKLSFEDRSTRKHYPGDHRIVVVVNGVEKAEAVLKLL